MFAFISLLLALPLAAAVHYEPRGHYYYPIALAPNSTITPFPTSPTTTATTVTTTFTTCYTTQYPAICPSGICTSTYTITESCPTTCKPHTETSYLPPGFTTTTTVCHHCAPKPTTITLTHPTLTPKCGEDGKECPPEPCYGYPCPKPKPSETETDNGCGGHECPPPTAPTESDNGCDGYGCQTATATLTEECGTYGCASDVPTFTGGAGVIGSRGVVVVAVVVAVMMV
ncbi:hypothetical protein BDD12DRAFT_927555 [Trichophaea hybrida]|nr:hypothetical protein BDD12DRAFT_927555 [Trichophaea hybrida]